MKNKWGIIGPGNIAHDFVRDLQLVSSPQVVHAVLGNEKDNTEDFASKFGIPGVYYDLDKFIKTSGVDIIYVATPHTLHHEEVLACLENKIPVLCEKPMTINSAQCEELVSAARRNNTFLMEGMWIRFVPSIQLVLDLIKRGTIGKIVSIRASMCLKAEYDTHSRLFDPGLGGGSLLDLGIYPVFLSLLLLGKPDIIKAIGTLSPEGIDEDCSVLLHYNSGPHAILESSLVSHSEAPAEIVGEKGVINILHPWFEKAAGIELHLHDEGKVIYPCQWEGRGLQFETEEVLSCINSKKISSDILSHAFSMDMISILDEIRSQIKVRYGTYE